MNFDESKLPSVANTIAFLPWALSCWARSCVCDASWNGVNTTFVLLSTFPTSAEKSVSFWVIDSESTLTPAFVSADLTIPARPVEYDSWSSTIMTLEPLVTPRCFIM